MIPRLPAHTLYLKQREASMEDASFLHYITRGVGGVVDHEKEIIFLRGKVATLEANIQNLIGWQHTQNGTLKDMDGKITGIYKTMIGTAGTAALSFLGTIVTLLAVLAGRE